MTEAEAAAEAWKLEGLSIPSNTGNIKPIQCYLGCDPELFIEKPGQGIVGSERAIPAEGIKTHNHISKAQIIRDGIQVELNPNPVTCRAGMATSFVYLFKNLKATLDAQGMKVNFSTVVDVPKEEFAALSEMSRRLGCAPSLNEHDATATISPADVESLARSAGGHIHLGLTEIESGRNGAFGNYLIDARVLNKKRLVRVLDLLLGNTCVLIDRDPRAAERRKVYGRAGEFRLPAHGLEYRTLSNFWLRSWPVASMVFGLARLAVTIEYWGLSDEFLKLVPAGDIVRAINTNDAVLAKANFDKIKPFIAEKFVEHKKELSIYSDIWPLTAKKIEDFEFFITKPLEYWFPQDPMVYWTEVHRISGKPGTVGREAWDDGHMNGWESFLVNTVRPQRLGAAAMEAAMGSPIAQVEVRS